MLKFIIAGENHKSSSIQVATGFESLFHGLSENKTLGQPTKRVWNEGGISLT